MGFGIGVGPSWARVRVSTRGVGMSAGPRVARMHVSNRGIGASTGLGPLSAWTGVQYPRHNRIVVGSTRSPQYLAEPAFNPHAIEMSSVTGLDAVALAGTGPGDLIGQLNAADKFAKWNLLAVLSTGLLLGGLYGFGEGSPLAGLAFLTAAAASATLTVFLYRKESIEHLVPVEYVLDGVVPAWVARMEQTWESLRRLHGSWRIVESGRVETTYQHKTNAGAAHLINRVRATFNLSVPRVLVANVSVPSVRSGSSTLYFLPDRVLVRTRRTWSDVGYEHLHVQVRHQRFIEDGTPPRDALQVDVTWKYVNKGGGPDRRFKDNRQLPVMLYGRVTLSSPQGLSWILDLSVTDVADQLKSSLDAHP